MIHWKTVGHHIHAIGNKEKLSIRVVNQRQQKFDLLWSHIIYKFALPTVNDQIRDAYPSGF